MKKNKFMRLASVLLVLTLLSTCAISGTYAKYVTTGSATETARVAKWGVVITGSSPLFKSEYATDDSYHLEYKKMTISAKADNGTDLIAAPGTGNDNVACLGVTGKPEVLTSVNISFEYNQFAGSGTGDPRMITLPAGTYRDYTSMDPNATFTTTETYHPIKWTVEQKTSLDADWVVKKSGVTLKEAADFIEGLGGSFDPNTDLGEIIGEIRLSWKWDYTYVVTDPEDPDNEAKAKLVDQMDTYLGQVATFDTLPAGWVTPESTYADPDTGSLEEGFVLNITVLQVD